MPIGSNPPPPPGCAPARKSQHAGPDLVCPACRQALQSGHVVYGVEGVAVRPELFSPIAGCPESECHKQRQRKLEKRARRQRASGGYQPDPIAGKPVPPSGDSGQSLTNQELRASIEATHTMIRSTSPGSEAIGMLEGHLSALLTIEQYRAHGA